MLRVAGIVALGWVAMLAHYHHAVHAAVWRLPLERHEAEKKTSEAITSAQWLAVISGSKKASVWEPGAFSEPSKHSPMPVDFRDIRKNMFAAKIAIGSPPQLVSLVLDISSSDIMVLNQVVDKHLYYNHTKSTTYQANGTQVKMFEGEPIEMDGFVSKDHVALGGVDGTSRIEVQDQVLVELTGSKKMLAGFPSKMDGFIGIGRGSATTTGAPSIVRAMIDQQLLDSPIVGLSYSDVTAHVVIGGVDAPYIPQDFHFYAQHHPDDWSVPASTIEVDSKQVLSDVGSISIVGSDIMIGPGDLVDELADAVGAENYALPCDGPGPNITFQLEGGFRVTLTKNDYAIPQDQGWCVFGIFQWSHPRWVLGLPLIRNVYTVLDYGASQGEQRIGFANLKP